MLAKQIMEDSLQDDTQPQEIEFSAWHELLTRVRRLLQGEQMGELVLQPQPDNAKVDYFGQSYKVSAS